MSFIPTLGCVQATASYTGPAGAIAQNRWYCAAAADAPTEDDLTEVATIIMAWMLDGWNNLAANDWELSGLEIRAMNEAEGIAFTQVADLPVDGVSGGTSTANQVTNTITFNTGLVGRSARGRTYMVGLQDSYHNQTRLTDAGQATMQEVWDTLRSSLEAGGHALQVVSFVDGGVVREEGRKLGVVSLNARFPLATQRRRLT